MNDNDENWIPEGWAKYGIPSGETVVLRNAFAISLWQALENIGIQRKANEWDQMTISSGAEIFFIRIIDQHIVERRDEIEQIVRNIIPKGFAYEIVCEK